MHPRAASGFKMSYIISNVYMTSIFWTLLSTLE